MKSNKSTRSKHDKVACFVNGFAEVKLNGKWFTINEKGERVNAK